MNLTNDQLHTLVMSDPSDAEARAELARRVISRLRRLIPNPTGACPHGHKIEWDQRGAYSSGYPIHVGLPGYCDLFRNIVNDPPSPETLRIRALCDQITLDFLA